MKKIIALMLVLMLCLALVACDGKKPAETTPGGGYDHHDRDSDDCKEGAYRPRRIQDVRGEWVRLCISQGMDAAEQWKLCAADQFDRRGK